MLLVLRFSALNRSLLAEVTHPLVLSPVCCQWYPKYHSRGAPKPHLPLQHAVTEGLIFLKDRYGIRLPPLSDSLSPPS